MKSCPCGNISENRDTGLCARCARDQRKELERARRVKIVTREIKKISPKMAEALKEYSKLRKQFLEANPVCAVYPNLRATTVHHSKGRRTIELLLDTNFWIPASMEGHDWIERHPDEAKEKGFSLSRLAKDEPHKI